MRRCHHPCVTVEALLQPTDAWRVELVLGLWLDDRRALRRDVERGILVRVRRGVYVQAGWWSAASDEERHVVQVRAFAATTREPPVFSHWTAAVLHGLPMLDPRLVRLHTTVPEAGDRGNDGVFGHVYGLSEAEVVERSGLRFTSVARTVVDVAGSGTTEEGIVLADAALAAGLPKDLLLAAVDLAGPRKAARRIDRVVGFSDGGAKSPLESTSRWTIHRLGLERPVLQHPVRDVRGYIGDLDFWFPEAQAGGEADGREKYLNPAYAPRGAGMKVHAEKVREDRMLAAIRRRLARWGWAESRSPQLLAPVLAAVGVVARRVVRV